MHGTKFSISWVLHHLVREILLGSHGSSVGRKNVMEGLEDIPFMFIGDQLTRAKLYIF